MRSGRYNCTMPHSLHEVQDLLRPHLEYLKRRFGVRSLFIFGSTARGVARTDSDVDVLVDFEPGHRVGLFQFIELQLELERLIGRRVDLATRDALRPEMRDDIIREAVLAA